MKRHLVILIFLAGITGCTESADSVTREYRNTTNEGIDAMMMVTSEARARIMLVRVLKPITKRFVEIDEHLEKLKLNRETKDLIREIFESDSAHLYLSELEVNRERFGMEFTRIKNLLKQSVDYERERTGAEVNERMSFPGLSDLVHGQTLSQLRKQLEQPKFVDIMLQFPKERLIKNYPDMYEKYKAKREVFKQTRAIKLID